MLTWATAEIVRGFSREYRALVGDDVEYVIKGPSQRTVPATRTVQEFYVVSHIKAGDEQHIGEVPTLKDAKAFGAEPSK